MLNSIPPVITDDMSVDSQSDSRVNVSQLPLYDSRSYAIRE
jgi:hypothetical protein